MAKGKKTGGRTLGTPNKENPLKGYIKNQSIDYFTKPIPGADGHSQFELDLIDLTVEKRVDAQLKLLNKSMPDLKAVDANINSQSAKITIEARLRELCGEDDE